MRFCLKVTGVCFQSGKLVMKMFKKIQEVVSDRDALVCVLIDEVCCIHNIFVYRINCNVV